MPTIIIQSVNMTTIRYMYRDQILCNSFWIKVFSGLRLITGLNEDLSFFSTRKKQVLVHMHDQISDYFSFFIVVKYSTNCCNLCSVREIPVLHLPISLI